jgi:hypothetical protein
MMDEKMMPYAEWLEGFIKNLIEYQPEKIGVCAILPDGNVLTGYFGDCCPKDKAEMGFHMNNDGVLDTVVANAKEIVLAAEAEEDEGDERP